MSTRDVVQNVRLPPHCFPLDVGAAVYAGHCTVKRCNAYRVRDYKVSSLSGVLKLEDKPVHVMSTDQNTTGHVG